MPLTPCFLSLCLLSFCVRVCFRVCIFCSYGQFWRRWTHPVGFSRRGRSNPGATHPQLPPTPGHLVQRRPQDPTQQSHVSLVFLTCFVLFFLTSGVFSLLYFMFPFDPGSTFLLPLLFPGTFESFSIRASVPSCRFSFISLHFVLKVGLNFSCRTRSKSGSVLAVCEMKPPLCFSFWVWKETETWSVSSTHLSLSLSLSPLISVPK